MPKTLSILAASVLAAAAWPAAAEDLTIVSNTTAMGQKKTSTAYMAADKFARGDGETGMILDYGSGRIVSLDHKKKQYWESSTAEMRAMAEQASERVKQMGEQMKQNPRAAQMMEKLMGGSAAAATVQKGTAMKRIAGYDCNQYTIAVGDSVKMEIWTASALQPPAQLFDARKSLFPPGNPMADRIAKVFDEMKKIQGYPLAETMTFSVMGHGTLTTTEATEVKKGPIPASAFAVPEGFTQVESPYKKFATAGK